MQSVYLYVEESQISPLKLDIVNLVNCFMNLQPRKQN